MDLNLKKIGQSFSVLIVMSVVLGGIYPLGIYIASQTFKRPVLLGQDFTDPKFFWGRLISAEEKKNRIERYNTFQSKHNLPNIFSESEFPLDFISNSASGLDPHISLQSAKIQIDRVSRETGRYRALLEDYIALSTEERGFGFLGQVRVNVVKLNLLIHG